MLQEINIYLGIVSNNEVLGKISQLNFFFLNLGESGNRYAVSAFLFSLKNPTNDPRKLPHMVGKSYSMRDYAHVGPSFGEGMYRYRRLRAILQESEAKLEMKNSKPPSIFVWR